MTTMIENNVADRVRNEFRFSVDKFPLTGPEGLRTPHYGLFRSDNGECIGRSSVSGRYVPHTTDDVLALVEAAGSAFGGVADVRCFFRDGHYVAVQPTREYREAIFGTKDNVFPRLMIDAPYGGLGSFTATLGFYRDACRNMAILRQVSGSQVAIRHTSGLRLQMDELLTAFGTLERGWQNLANVIRDMEARRVRMVDFLNAIYGEPDDREGRSLTIHRNRTEAIFRRLQRERLATGRGDMGSDFTVSGWEAFNAVQGYVQHDATRRGNPSEMARIVRAMHDSHVARAERLVLELAV
jgi:hypothetical protein